jgi:cytoskeleton protein RodZ
MAVEAGSIGARLRAGREKLGLTVLQAAERLHTDPRILDAIEADDFAALGAPVYARGHIKHYAELVGEPPLELNALYSSLSHVSQPDLTKIAKAPPAADSTKLVAPALLVIAVFAVAGAVWWVSALSGKKSQLSETHVVGPLVSESPGDSGGQSDAAGTAKGSATGSATGGTNSASSAPGAVASSAGQARTDAVGTKGGGGSPAAAPRRASSANGPAMQARVGGPASSGTTAQSRGATPGARAASGAGTAQGAATAAPTVSGGAAPPSSASTDAMASNAGTPRSKHDATVTLRYSADSWTEVYDASGTRLFYDVGAANTVQNFTGTYPLRVVLGNAAGVSVEFNGRNASIASLSHPDGSAQFSINRSGRVVRARPVADGG